MNHSSELEKINNPEIDFLDKFLFKPFELKLKMIEKDVANQNYNAPDFQLNNQKIIFRTAKITPTKIGQFVTVWKRNELGITAPYDILDNFDAFIIATRKDQSFGVFILPKAILTENNIISDGNKNGKRGIRVYPPWDLTINKQAQKTQLWQIKYFLDLSDVSKLEKKIVETLFANR